MKNRIQTILHRNLIALPDVTDLFGKTGRAFLEQVELPEHDRFQIDQELDLPARGAPPANGEPYRWAPPVHTHEKIRKVEILAGSPKRKGGLKAGEQSPWGPKGRRAAGRADHQMARLAQAQYEELVRLRTCDEANPLQWRRRPCLWGQAIHIVITPGHNITIRQGHSRRVAHIIERILEARDDRPVGFRVPHAKGSETTVCPWFRLVSYRAALELHPDDSRLRSLLAAAEATMRR